MTVSLILNTHFSFDPLEMDMFYIFSLQWWQVNLHLQSLRLPQHSDSHTSHTKHREHSFSYKLTKTQGASIQILIYYRYYGTLPPQKNSEIVNSQNTWYESMPCGSPYVSIHNRVWIKTSPCRSPHMSIFVHTLMI